MVPPSVTAPGRPFSTCRAADRLYRTGSYVAGGILAVVRAKARAKNVHWMFFTLSAVVYVVAWYFVTSG